MEDSNTISFFGCDRDIVHTNSELLSLHTQNTRHTQTGSSQPNYQYVYVSGGHKVTSLAEEQLASTGFTEQAAIFLRVVSSRWIFTYLYTGKTDLSLLFEFGCTKQRGESGIVRIWKDLEDRDRGDRDKKHYTMQQTLKQHIKIRNKKHLHMD